MTTFFNLVIRLIHCNTCYVVRRMKGTERSQLITVETWNFHCPVCRGHQPHTEVMVEVSSVPGQADIQVVQEG